MITHLNLEYLGLGQIPVYEVEPGNIDFGRRVQYLSLDEGCRSWSICETARRLLVSLHIDTMVEALEPQLRMWLGMLGQEADGTLYFPIRSIGTLPGEVGTLVIAGCAYGPGIQAGAPLDGADPTQLIVQACQETRFFEPPPPNLETYHPVLRRAVEGVIQRRREHEESIQTEAEIEARSRALLHECLDDAQLAEMTEKTQFHVQGGDGHTYRIKKGHGHNVFRIEDGRPTVEYCLVQGFVPVYDLMLTQKLLLEVDPGTFISTANAKEVPPGEVPLMDHPNFHRVEPWIELEHHLRRNR